MDRHSFQILLVEDDPQDTLLVKELIFESNLQDCHLTIANSLANAIEAANKNKFDIALMDIGLPDSEGVNTLRKFKQHDNDLPVVILTGLDDEAFGIKLVQMGAQDYLVKGHLNAQIFQRTLRFAIERQVLLNIIGSKHQQAMLDGEISSLDEIESFKIQSTTGRLLGQTTLDESIPDIFNELVLHYTDIIEKNIESKLYKVNHPLSASIKKIADQLGYLRASPRDVIAIHTKVMGKITREFSAKKKAFHYTQSRIVLIEALGNLVSYYRNYALGSFGSVDINASEGVK